MGNVAQRTRRVRNRLLGSRPILEDHEQPRDWVNPLGPSQEDVHVNLILSPVAALHVIAAKPCALDWTDR